MRQLADWRRARGLTQVELAALAGCDQSTISAIERGASPSAKLLGKLVEVLEVEPDALKVAVLDLAPAPSEAA